MTALPREFLDATLAADHPRLAALSAAVDARARQGRGAQRERALLADLLERSRSRHAARLARLPRPEFPAELPIAQHRERIMELVRDHPVTIVCGETGSGKTTQIPKICLAMGRGAAGFIGCTQPRRIAARSLAHRLAHELPGAPKGLVGHKIRFQDATRPDTVVKIDHRRGAARGDPFGPGAARLRHAHHRRGPRAQPERGLPAGIREAPRRRAPRAEGDRHLRHHRHGALRALLRRRARDRGLGPHLPGRGALPARVLRGAGRGRRAGGHERGDREGGRGDRPREPRWRRARVPAGRARDPRGRGGAAQGRAGQGGPGPGRDPAAVFAPLGRGAGPCLRARRAPPDRARDQRRGDLAHGPRHPLRDRHGARAPEALLAAPEDRPAAHRADLAGVGAPARGALRACCERRGDPAV